MVTVGDRLMFCALLIAMLYTMTQCNYPLELLPVMFLASPPVVVAVSAQDSEYAGIAVLLSIAALGQRGSQQRADAGYNTRLERVYRWILIVFAVSVMTLSSVLSFLRTDVPGQHVSFNLDYRFRF